MEGGVQGRAREAAAGRPREPGALEEVHRHLDRRVQPDVRQAGREVRHLSRRVVLQRHDAGRRGAPPGDGACGRVRRRARRQPRSREAGRRDRPQVGRRLQLHDERPRVRGAAREGVRSRAHHLRHRRAPAAPFQAVVQHRGQDGLRREARPRAVRPHELPGQGHLHARGQPHQAGRPARRGRAPRARDRQGPRRRREAGRADRLRRRQVLRPLARPDYGHRLQLGQGTRP